MSKSGRPSNTAVMAIGDIYKLLKYKGTSTDAMAATGGKLYVWAPHEDKRIAFQFGEILEGTMDNDPKSKAKIKVRLGSGDIQEIECKRCFEKNPPKFDGTDDCSNLGYLNEASVLHNLKLRYDDSLIYTYSGLFCVALNPYKWIPVYTNQVIDMYTGRRRGELPPHVFAVADGAYRSMVNEKQNQSMLITGESGAGKTENTKKVIQYIAGIAGRGEGGGTLEQQLVECNPMLEAFGNAKTLRNDNSSRFGKFIKLQFTPGGQVNGATINSYLLEKNRVVFQNPGERSFHIFYQMLAGCSAEQKKNFMLTKVEDFPFLRDPSAMKVSTIDDVDDWKHTNEAMDVMQFKPDEKESIFRIIAGIMQLGRLSFKDDNKEHAQIVDKKIVGNIAALLKVKPADLEAALITPRVKAGTEIVKLHLSAVKADASRNALAKMTYNKLFFKIVSMINKVLSQWDCAHFIGVLDIAGFEIFEFNTFEQLCINFTNEKLQQFFNNHMFKLEQEEYVREELNWTFIDFGMDSQDRIDLIEKKPTGILSILEEESFFPKATDKTMLAKLAGAHKRNQYFKLPQFKDSCFELVHYAGIVQYDVNDWLEKNRDPLQDDLEMLFKGSEDAMVAELFSEEFKFQVQYRAGGNLSGALGQRSEAANSGALGSSAKRGGNKIMVTVGTQHKDQLNQLMDTLQATTPHFIRCILPNHEKRAGKLDADIVLDQLRCNGVLEGIRIARKGFPNRLPYAEFVKRFYLLSPKVDRFEGDHRRSTQTLLDEVGEVRADDYRFGKTKIFFRAGALAKMEEAREALVARMIITVQSGCRGWLGRKLFGKLRMQSQAAKIVHKACRQWLDFRAWGWWGLWQTVVPIVRRELLEKLYRARKQALTDLENAMAEAEKQKQAQEAKIAENSATMEAMYANINTAKQRQTELSDANKQSTENNARMEGDLEQMAKDIVAEQQEKDDTERGGTKLKDRVDEVDHQLSRETTTRQHLEEQKRTNEARIAELDANVAALDDKIARLEATKRSLTSEKDDVTGSLEAERDNVSNAEKAIAKLRTDNDAAQQDIDALQKQNTTMMGEKQRLDTLNKNTREELEKERGESTSNDAAIKDLMKKIATLRDKVDGGSAEAKARSAAIKKLEDELDARRNDLNSEREQKRSLEANNRRLDADLKDFTSKHDAEKREREELENWKRKGDADLAELKRQLQAANARIDQLEKQKAALEQEFADLTSRLSKEQADRDVVEKATKRLKEELTQVQEKMGDTSAKQAEVNRLKKQLEQQLQSLNDEYDDVHKARENAVNAVQALSAELMDLQSSQQDLQLKNTALDAAVKKVADELADTKQQQSENSALADQAEKKRRALQEEYNSLNRNMEDATGQFKELEKNRKDIGDQVAELKRQIEAEVADRNKLDLDRKAKERELADLVADLDEKEHNAQQSERGVKKLESELESVKGKMADDEADVRKLKKQEEELEDRVRDLQAQLAAKEGQSMPKEELDRKQAELAALRNELALKSDERAAADRAKKTAEGKAHDAATELADLNAQVHKLGRQKKELDEDLDRLKDMVGRSGEGGAEAIRNANDNEIKKLKEMLATEKALRTQAEATRRTAEAGLDDLKNKARDAESERATQKQRAVALETELEMQTQIYRAEHGQKLNVAGTVNRLKAEVERANKVGGGGAGRVPQEVIDKLKEEQRKLEADLDECKLRRAEEEDKNAGLLTEVGKYRKEVEEGQTEALRLQHMKDGLESQIKIARDRLEQRLGEQRELEDEINSRSGNTEEIRKQLLAIEEAVARAERDKKAAEDNVADLKKKIQNAKNTAFTQSSDDRKQKKELADLASKLDTEIRSKKRADEGREKAERDFKEIHKKWEAQELARQDAEKSVEASKNIAAAAKKHADELRRELDKSDIAKKDLERQIREARAQIEDERRARVRAEQASQAAEKSVENTKERLSAAEREREDAENSKVLVASELDGLKMEGDTIAFNRKEMDEMVKDLQRQLNTLNSEVKLAEKARADALESQNDLDEAMRELQSKLDGKEGEVKSLEAAGVSLDKQIRDAYEKNMPVAGSASTAVADAETNVRRLNDRIDEEQSVLVRMEGESKGIKQEGADMRSKQHKLEDELSSVKSQLEREKRESSILEKKLTSFTRGLGH